MKVEPMYKRYQNKQPIGVYTLCNTVGVLFFEPDENDKYNDNCDVIAAYASETRWGFHRHKIHYNSTGRAYIRKGSYRIYLDEVIRYI